MKIRRRVETKLQKNVRLLQKTINSAIEQIVRHNCDYKIYSYKTELKDYCFVIHICNGKNHVTCTKAYPFVDFLEICSNEQRLSIELIKSVLTMCNKCEHNKNTNITI